MGDKKKIGLMGCGAVAAYGHLPAIRDTEGLILHAIFDPNEENLKKKQEAFSVEHAFTKEEDFFNCDLDAVAITSPAPCHKDNVLQAAQNKLPVICEKPLAMNREEVLEMKAAMESAGVPLYTGFCYRFSPSALKIRELVQGNAIGEVKSLRLIYNWGMHGKYNNLANGDRELNQRRVGRMVEGGPMVDCGTHQIDLAHFWLGSEVIAFHSHGAWVDEYEAPDHLWLHMDHANGAHTMVEMSYSYHHTSKNIHSEFIYELIGTKGVIRYDRKGKFFRMENELGTQEFPLHHEKSFEGMYSEWYRSLLDGHSDLLTGPDDSMRVVDLARSATEQAIAGRNVK